MKQTYALIIAVMAIGFTSCSKENSCETCKTTDPLQGNWTLVKSKTITSDAATINDSRPFTNYPTSTGAYVDLSITSDSIFQSTKNRNPERTDTFTNRYGFYVMKQVFPQGQNIGYVKDVEVTLSNANPNTKLGKHTYCLNRDTLTILSQPFRQGRIMYVYVRK
jgi:hypothetical protein